MKTEFSFLLLGFLSIRTKSWAQPMRVCKLNLSPGKIMSLSPASVQKRRRWTETGIRVPRDFTQFWGVSLHSYVTIAESRQRKKDKWYRFSHPSRSQQRSSLLSRRPPTFKNLRKHWWQSCLSVLYTHCEREEEAQQALHLGVGG